MSNRYYIDPVAGSDSHCGTAREQPWRSFVHLETLALGAGDRVEILAPGAFDTSLFLKGAAGSKDDPVCVVFAPGRYDLHPEALQRRCYNISNNNEEPDVPKHVGVLIEGSRHVVVSGPGARLVCRAKMIVVCIDDSENVTIRDLAVDYHRPTVSEFNITSVNEDSADIAVHPDSHYTVTDGAITWQGEGWRYATGLAQELIPETGRIWRLKDPLVDMRIEEIEPGVIRAHGTHAMTAGRVFQLRDTYRDCVGMFVRRSRGVTFDALQLFYLHGMGIVGQLSEDITLNKVSIAPEAGSGRTCSVWADSTHFSSCRGKIAYKDCVFDGAHDDAINIHGTHMQIQEVVSETCVRLRFMQRQTYGFMNVNPGDEIDFVRWDSMRIFGTCKARDVEMIDPYELRVTFEEPIPADTRVLDVIENVTWTPEAEITGCTIKRIPTRGFLLTTRKKVVVSGNRFVRIHRNGINVESDAANWFESGCVRDMTICDNRFEECGGEAILISPRHSVPNSSVHQNTRITGNTFVLPEQGSAVNACGVEGLTITGNHIEMLAPIHGRTTIAVNDCDNVVIEDNELMLRATALRAGGKR
jgi:hypothetical protein